MDSIRQAVETFAAELARDPGVGARPDATAVAVREDGLRIRVRGPNGEVVSDMAPRVGGAGTAPTPGWFMRAALAACDATTIVMQAALDGIELTELEVTVDSVSDSRGAFGVDGAIPAGPLEVRVRIELAASNATGEQLRELVRRAEASSAVGDALARPVPVTTEVVSRS